MNPQSTQETPFLENLKQLLGSIEHALQSKYYLSAQILIYAGIDSAAWLTSNTNEKVGERFQRWVNRWMLPAKPLPATAADLYAARCAVLHTFTADSDMSKKGTARRIAYATGQAIAKELQARLDSDSMGRSDLVVVHIDDLFDAFRLGYANYFESLKSDPAAFARTKAKMDKYSIHIDGDALKEFLE